MKYLLLSTVIALTFSCNSQEKNNNPKNNDTIEEKKPGQQIGDYVVETFQDSNGNLWFGTLSKGVAKYDGNSVQYFTPEFGLAGNLVSSIVEDENGNLWMGTDYGLSRYDGKTFTNFSIEDGLCHNRVSVLLRDRHGTLWIGTWGGVCTYDGESFELFDLPDAKTKTFVNQDTKNWITEITEDSKGNIWIARDGNGVVCYNGESFDHFLRENGLLSNCITEVEEDNQGRYWFGSRIAEKDHPDPNMRTGPGGVNIFDGDNFEMFPEVEAFTSGEVYEVFKDSEGNMWIATTKNGMYKFWDGEFEHYDVPVSVMSITEDQEGVLWLGGAGGLYKIDNDKKIINVTVNGPWN